VIDELGGRARADCVRSNGRAKFEIV
jgi:hypothetical protein